MKRRVDRLALSGPRIHRDCKATLTAPQVLGLLLAIFPALDDASVEPGSLRVQQVPCEDQCRECSTYGGPGWRHVSYAFTWTETAVLGKEGS